MEFNNNKKIIQTIFRSYFSRINSIKLPLKDIKAADSIMHCRTTEQGYNLLACPNEHEEKIQTHSCKHRSCPICADKSRLDWIESEKSRLLNCSHFHVVFTIPHEYLNLWQYNRKWFTKIFFKACRDTLMELLKDKKYLGATPGILMTLHTWGRQLNYHPHIHCLITAGGITRDNQWKELDGKFLLPIRVVKLIYRGKLQSFIKEGIENKDINIPENENLPTLLRTHRQLYKKQWSVRIQDKYNHGKGVVLYLARYLKGGPINPRQIISCNEHITFSFKDHRDQKIKTLKLKIDEFMRRLLWHVPETGVHVVRHFGIYASNNHKKRNICRKVVGGIDEVNINTGKDPADTINWYCKVCGVALHNVFSTFKPERYENYLIERAHFAHVQQNVHTNIAERCLIQRQSKIPP